MKLTATEINLLKELRDSGERTISGNKSHSDLRRLVEERYVNAQSINIASVLYKITDRGRAALTAAEGAS
jgi:hypothetical protein